MTNSTVTVEESPQRARIGAPWAKIAGAAALLCAAVSLMLLAFVAPLLPSGPDNLPLGVSGPDAATDTIAGQLQSTQPGVFDIETYDSLEALEDATLHRQIVGGLVHDGGVPYLDTVYDDSWVHEHLDADPDRIADGTQELLDAAGASTRNG